MNIKKLIFFKILIFLFLILIDHSYTAPSLVKFYLPVYEQYASVSYDSNSNKKYDCQINNFAIVFQDQYQINNFSSNVFRLYNENPKRIYYENNQQLYSLIIQNIPIGETNEIYINVTNINNETSNFNIKLNQPFICKKYSVESMGINYISNFYNYQSLGWAMNLGLNISNDFDISNTVSCKISFCNFCLFGKYSSYYMVVVSSPILEQMNQPQFKLVLSDIFGGNKTIMIDNILFSTSITPSIIKSIDLIPANNSLIERVYVSDLKASIEITYSELNSNPYIRNDVTKQLIADPGTLVLGTPEEQTISFSISIDRGKSNYTILDIANQITKIATFNYTSEVRNNNKVDLKQIVSIDQSLETNNLLFKLLLELPFLDSTFYVMAPTPMFVYSQVINYLDYPYGISKTSTQNPYWSYSYESLFPFSNIGSQFAINYGGISYYSIGDSITPIPNYPGLITSDVEGPILRYISYQLLDNNKLLITMNITDVGSGVFYINCDYPSFTFYANQSLVSGDINNGIYQILIDVGEIYLNQIQLYAYDYMGNKGLSNAAFSYYNLNFGSVNPILNDSITLNDITYFKFNRLKVDTSFEDLQVILNVNFNGASELSSIPKLLLINNLGRTGITEYKGVFNQTTQMFDIKFNVLARERGYFTYSLLIPPLFLSNQDLEALFPTEKILLTTNYVDHYPPTISNLESLTNVNLSINQGDEIEIGWNVEVYDYPVGLDYAYFEVVSNVDMEPYKFTFSPNISIPGDDINSTYTISFKVKPLVNQIFYISKVELYDKNGYNSQYPASQKKLNSFFKKQFSSKRNINITVNPNIVDNNAPELLSLAFPTSFDSFGINRTLIFEFTVKDDLSGISLRHNPYVYVQFFYDDHYKSQAQLINIEESTLIHYYRAVVEFEYGKLVYGAIVSINGITDNSLNIVSYSSSQLKALGFPSTIVNPIQTRPPVILDFTDLNENGGKLFLYGKEFTNSPIVYMDKGNGFEIITPTFVSNLALTLNIPNVKGINSIKFKVNSKQLDSNIITVIPMVNPIAPNSNCTLYNDCSGKGQCINSQCVCNSGSSGPDCSSTPNEINNSTNNTPSFSSLGTMVEINQLDEIDIHGNIVNSYPLTSWSSSTIKSQYQLANAYQYTNALGNTGTNVTIVVDIFNDPTTINFASNTLKMDKGTIKYTISLNSYPFGSRFNTLQLKVNASIEVNNSTCKLNSYSLREGTNSLEWIKLRSNDKSIYGKFIQSALVDYRSISIQNNLLVVPTYEIQSAVIGIQIPFYYQNAVLDPDFSVLLDSDNLGANKGSSCYYKNSSGLSTSKIVIVSVICGVVGIAIVIASVILFFKKKQIAKFKKYLKNNSK